MFTIDYLLAAIVLLSALMGLFRGFVREALSLVGWVLAVWCAGRFGGFVAGLIPSIADDSSIEIWVARIIIFVTVLILNGLLGRLIAFLVHQSGLSSTDRLVGMIFGMARGGVLVSLVVLLLAAAGFDANPWWQESKLIPYAAPLAEQIADIAGEGIDLLKERVDSAGVLK